MNTKTRKPTQTPPLLTEEEILKMSEDDYMNPAQLAFFKARLEKMEQDLIRNAGQTTENLRETTLVPDPADRATIEEEHALELRTRDRERKLLKKVSNPATTAGVSKQANPSASPDCWHVPPPRFPSKRNSAAS